MSGAGTGGGLPRDPGAFEAFLSERIALPGAARREIEGLATEDLRREAQVVNERLKRFAAAVALSVEHPDGLFEFLAELEPRAISRDHDWRGVFAALKREAPDAARSRGVLIRYMQYLSERKRALDDALARRAGLETTDVHTDVTSYLALQARMRRRESSAGGGQFLRLAIGTTVALRMPPEGRLELLLAGHQFTLVLDESPHLVDLKGTRYPLGDGRNVIGRHPDCEVVLPGELRNISRAHVVIERIGERAVNLTDLSSKGTFLPAEILLGPL